MKPTKQSIEEHDIGTPKDYAQQIIAAFKNLEHGVTDFHGHGVMEAGEEDDMYMLIMDALTKAHAQGMAEERERLNKEWRKHLQDVMGDDYYLFRTLEILEKLDKTQPDNQ